MSAGKRRSDAHRLLVRALQAKAGEPATVETTRSEAWASATFHGARHAITLRLEGDEAARRATRLAERLDGIEFDLPGHLVADITLAGREELNGSVAIRIEALTVEVA